MSDGDIPNGVFGVYGVFGVDCLSLTGEGKKVIQMADKLEFTKGIEWKPGDKPRVNVWYRTRDYEDMLSIRPDYKLKDKQLYKIVVYFHGDNIYTGKILSKAQSLIKEMCFAAVMCSIKPDQKGE